MFKKRISLEDSSIMFQRELCFSTSRHLSAKIIDRFKRTVIDSMKRLQLISENYLHIPSNKLLYSWILCQKCVNIRNYVNEL